MIIYKDVLNNAELFTDSYKMVEVEGTEGALFEVTGKYITETTDIDDSMIGGNASAEAPVDDGGAEASSKSGVDIVLANRLEEVGLQKKEFKVHIKPYMKLIMDKMDAGRVEAFKKGAEQAMKKILAIFDDCTFYVGEGQMGRELEEAPPPEPKPDAEAAKPAKKVIKPGCMLIPAIFEQDGKTVKMYFWKDGLEEEKA